MRKTIFPKVILAIITALVLFPSFLFSQCTGAAATGYYTNGKQPVANGKYFINHAFSTFSSNISGALNGNNIAIINTLATGTNTITTTSPGSTIVAGTSYPSTSPQQQNVAPAQTGTTVLHTFTSSLSTGTYLWIQDCDINEGWTITFKDASNAVVDPTNFTLLNLSTTTTALPTFTKTTSNISIRGVTTSVTEPLVGIIINSSVKTISFAVTNSTGISTTQTTKFFYSVPLTPSFTATASSNSTICSGSTLNLTASTSALAATVPTPLTYTWSGPNSYTASTQNPSITSATIAAAGTYNVTVQDAFGCTSVIAGTAVAINQTPSVSLSSNTPVNYGSNISLSASISGGSLPYTIGWTGPNGFVSSTQNPSVSTVTSANGGVYKFAVTDNNACSISTTTYVGVNSGWIYFHNKCINEESSANFTVSLKDNNNNVLKTFITIDSANSALNMYDIGAGHDDGAGELWAIAGTAAGTSGTGTVYRRQSGSNLWQPTTVTTATAIDGAGLNQFVYISAGDAYYYNAGTSTIIFNHLTSHNTQTASANDVAYGGGKIAVRNSNGRVYLYTGDLTNDSWTDISANTSIAERIDVSSGGSMILYIRSSTVYAYNISTASTTTYPVFTTTAGAGQSGTRDIAIDDNGTIYATGTSGNTTCCGNTEIVFSYPAGATSWTAEPEARGVKRLTGGPGGQAWGGVNLGNNFSQTIYSRVTDNLGTHLWLDDERVKNSNVLYGNSVMMEVPTGIYKVTEALPNNTWDLGRYNIYDPTGNSSGNVLSNTTTIRPANGEVVHVEYINEKLNPKVIDNGNCTTNILQSFDAGTGSTQFGTGTFGTPLEGTSYHYFNLTSPQDGYYSIVNTTDGNWFSSPGVTDHTGNNGYFLLVNASYAKDEFYRQRITGLTQNLTYRIQFYVSNIAAANPIQPKIRFGMQTLDGTIFGDSTTPDIPLSTWQRYSVSFTVPAGVTTADLFIRNENIGGSGNDLAIDDIAINPIPTPLVTNVISPANFNNLCIGTNYTISNTVTGGTWTIDNTTVATVDNTSGVITVKDTGAAKITYTYINNSYCVSTSSDDVTISVPPVVQASATSSDVCKSNTTILLASPSKGKAPYTYLWSGSNGTLSSPTSANPVLTPPTDAGDYNYTLRVTDSLGCVSPVANTVVTVHVPVASINPLCVTTGITPYARLMEAGGTSGASWLWSTTTDGALFYAASDYNYGTPTSSLQYPYIDHGGNYKVLVTDPYGCKDSSSFLYEYSSCTILPATLMDFSATLKGNVVLLNWVTSTETNTKYYAIEKSNNKRVWQEAGRVTAAGNSTEKSTYQFTDALPFAGNNYYRLRQVDADGKATISYVRYVKTNDAWLVKMYPNPVAGNMLQLQSNKRHNTIRITDINGNLLLNNKVFDDVLRLNISNFPAGFYMVQLISQTGETQHRSFVKK